MKLKQLILNTKNPFTLTAITAGLLLSATVQTQAMTESQTLISGDEIEKTALLLPAVQSAREAAMTETYIEGLEKLEVIGKYDQKLSVFTAKRPSKEDIEKRLSLAHKLGEQGGIKFSERPQRISETRIALRSAEDPSASFEVDLNTGNFLFNAGLNNYRGEQTTEGLPTKFEIQDLMSKTLEDLGLQVSPKEFDSTQLGGVNMGVHDERGGTMIYEKFKTLRVHRQLNDMLVEGDARMVFQFGEQASVANMVFQWPTITDAKPIPASLIQDATRLQQAALDRLQPMANKAESAKLKSVDLVLYDDGRGVLEPAYHIVMERDIQIGKEDPSMIPYDFYLPISSEPVAFFPDLAKSPEPKAEGAEVATSSTETNETEDGSNYIK